MPITAPVSYGTDLVTFADTAFWGADTDDALDGIAAERPRWFWERMLDAAAESGVTGIEITFPPFGVPSALTAFGDAAGIRAAFETRGLRLVSAFHNALDWADISPAAAAESLRGALEVLGEAGASVVVIGSPMIDAHEHPLGVPIVPETLARFAESLNTAGSVAAATGVRLAVHTESHSISVAEDDIRTLMMATDPATVGLCPDSAHITLMGGNPVRVALEHSPRVLLSHWKDASGPFPADFAIPAGEDVHHAHRVFMRELGEGVVDWAGWAAAMAITPTADLRLLELDAAADPVGAMRRARAFAATV